MTIALWADGARWALAGILVIAVITKWARPNPLQQGRADVQVLGVPARYATAVAIASPVVEAVLAATMLVIPGPIPVLLAMVVLSVYLVGLVRVVLAGERRPCRCFGVLTGRPLSWRAPARTGALLILGAFALPGAIGSPPWTAAVWFAAAFALLLLG